MSWYSDNNVKSRYLDPRIYVPNRRATFELDSAESAYLTNLRLTFLGVTSSAAHNYNDLVGCASLIRSIRLLDGKQELSVLNEAQFWRGFQNQNKPNAVAEKVDSNLGRTAVGLSILGSNSLINRIAGRFPADTGAAGNPSSSAFIDLTEMLPFLRAATHLPTDVFRNLRLEIEFNVSDQVVNNTTAVLNTIRPVLAVDVIENPKIVDSLNKQMNVVNWSEIEHDQFVIPQSANDGGPQDQGIVQNVNIKLNGYNNKIVDRFLIAKEIGNSAKEVTGANVVTGYGKFSSQCCYNQTAQFRVNGMNILPRNGMVGNNERLAHVCDTWGDCANYPGSNLYGIASDVLMTDGLQFRGQLDYIGVYFGKYIQDLQVEYSRTGLQAGAGANVKRATTDLLIAHCYAEVRKQFQMLPNGQYRISYIQE